MTFKEFMEGNRSQLALESLGGCKLMTENEKINTTDLIKAQGAGIALKENALVTINDKKTKQPKKVAVVTFYQLEGRYYMGGDALTRMVQNMRDKARDNGIVEEEHLSMICDGIMVKFEQIELENGNTYTDIIVL